MTTNVGEDPSNKEEYSILKMAALYHNAVHSDWRFRIELLVGLTGNMVKTLEVVPSPYFKNS